MNEDSVGAGLAAWLRVMPPGVDADVEAARQRIGRLSRQFELVLGRAAAAHDLTPGDWQALSALHRSGEPPVLTPKELGDLLGVTSGTVSVRIDRLARAGLVERVAAADGRSRPVRLTRKGRARWAAATKQRTDDEHGLFATALDAERLTALNALLADLLARFETEFGPASTVDRLGGDA
ncbi:MarR family transcriptional regulator [Amycolatopsis rhabdoformis]|uniref:MarR family transcriptional regulator n=1 Tax=Amycolatopsis rhabdoformis TaxID=1448059 RepID=A0ABZ1IJY2_9PSEU|nr:MarR family transcriptional regulator [Amycolatopsis rhabdoformis]WSE33775.1 MarR family transcriptional regulator [Amycolatopsis rhabdoformis]